MAADDAVAPVVAALHLDLDARAAVIAAAWWQHAILVGLVAGATIAIVLFLIGRIR